MPKFKVQGQVYHLAGSLLPLPNEGAGYLQMYFMGEEELEVLRRHGLYPGLDKDIVHELCNEILCQSFNDQTFRIKASFFMSSVVSSIHNRQVR